MALFRHGKNRLKLAILMAFCGEFCRDFGGEYDAMHVTFSVVRGGAGLDAFVGDSIILKA